uniref:Uncharacterized protein n=1 Tax=Setaria viridis TaxID=4556 RepID=A0A4U6TZK2_SETVI|nr:hypothetical protein SEVIR_7G336300v2 [Setaria viridis]
MGNCQAAEGAAAARSALGRRRHGGHPEPLRCRRHRHHAAGDASGSAPGKHLKLLRPDDTLLLGRVYRLVSFEAAKDEDEEAKPAANHRRRRASVDSRSAGERKESDRSLAKVMRQTEEVEPEQDPSSSDPSATKHGHTDAAADLDAELDALLLLGRRDARQWRPALQSIAEG